MPAIRSSPAVGAIAALLVAFALALVTGCGGQGSQAGQGSEGGQASFGAGEAGSVARAGGLQRVGRFGSLRDFVFYERAQDEPGLALLVDRFEATQSDWVAFAATAAGRKVDAQHVPIVAGRNSGSLPASGMDLRQARAFARWRLGRLPSEDEWRRVTVGGASSRYPWGSHRDTSRANTGELGLGEAMPVGTFESGRRSGGYAPYDLIGNVREWTETVPHAWCKRDLLQSEGAFLHSRRQALRDPALSVWHVSGLLPLGMIVGMGGKGVPRKAVGFDFETPIKEGDVNFGKQLAGDRRQRTGLRVYTTVDELLARLVGLTGELPDEDWRQVARFVARRDHRRVLRAALAASPLARIELPAGSIGRRLCDEIRRAPGSSR